MLYRLGRRLVVRVMAWFNNNRGYPVGLRWIGWICSALGLLWRCAKRAFSPIAGRVLLFIGWRKAEVKPGDKPTGSRRRGPRQVEESRCEGQREAAAGTRAAESGRKLASYRRASFDEEGELTEDEEVEEVEEEYRVETTDELYCDYDSTWETEETEERARSAFTRTRRPAASRHGKFNPFENAARDMQNYRHGYPQLKSVYLWSTASQDKPNLWFYLGQECSLPDGVFIDGFHKDWFGRYDKLERVHSYIQWLFPLQEPGMNREAKTLTKLEIEEFCQNETAKANLLKSYKLMLDFYGIRLFDEETGEVRRASNWRDRFNNLNSHTHNNLRITRILKCLGTLGFPHYQAPLVHFFLEETLVHRRLPKVKESVLNYFVFAVRDEKQRRRLIKFAYLNYERKDEFVWCPKKIQRMWSQEMNADRSRGDVKAENKLTERRGSWEVEESRYGGHSERERAAESNRQLASEWPRSGEEEVLSEDELKEDEADREKEVKESRRKGQSETAAGTRVGESNRQLASYSRPRFDEEGELTEDEKDEQDEEVEEEYRVETTDELYCDYDSTWETEETEERARTAFTRTRRPAASRHGKFNPFENAARDMQNYRHGYPQLKSVYLWSTASQDKPNLLFYLGQECSLPDGVFIDGFHKDWFGRYDQLERVHSYIQWLFPLQEPGMNHEAKTLTTVEIEEFCQNETAKANLLKSYKLMLDFYGIRLFDEETGEVRRASNWRDRFNNLNSHTHNNLRITRILKCLGTLGFPHYQAPLVHFFLEETLVHRQLPKVKESVLNYFVFAVRDEKQRRRLIKFAYLNYERKDEFVWCPKKIQRMWSQEMNADRSRGDVKAENKLTERRGSWEVEESRYGVHSERERAAESNRQLASEWPRSGEEEVLTEDELKEDEEDGEKEVKESRRKGQSETGGGTRVGESNRQPRFEKEEELTEDEEDKLKEDEEHKLKEVGEKEVEESRCEGQSETAAGNRVAESNRQLAHKWPRSDEEEELTEYEEHEFKDGKEHEFKEPEEHEFKEPEEHEFKEGKEHELKKDEEHELKEDGEKVDEDEEDEFVGKEYRVETTDELYCEYDSTWETEERTSSGSTRNRRSRRTRRPAESGNWQFNLFQNAARDMQNYRHGYPQLKSVFLWSTASQDKPNLWFYLGQKYSLPDGVFIDGFHKDWFGRYDKLEMVHSYIQWLFPLQEPGMNREARILTTEEIEEFCQNETAKANLLKSYKLMLDFYGIRLFDEETGEVQRASNWRDRFNNLNSHTHNNLRITRILKCLGTLGFPHYQAPLVHFFLEETLVHRQLPKVKESVLNYFVFAVRDEKQRRRLIKFAYLNYERKDEFVWCPKKIQRMWSQEVNVKTPA